MVLVDNNFLAHTLLAIFIYFLKKFSFKIYAPQFLGSAASRGFLGTLFLNFTVFSVYHSHLEEVEVAWTSPIILIFNTFGSHIHVLKKVLFLFHLVLTKNLKNFKHFFWATTPVKSFQNTSGWDTFIVIFSLTACLFLL